jgi:hypothetical protein
VKALPRLGEHDATGRALEKAGAKLGLEPLDALRDAGNGKAESLGRRSHAACRHDLREYFHIAKIGGAVAFPDRRVDPKHRPSFVGPQNRAPGECQHRFLTQEQNCTLHTISFKSMSEIAR